MNNNMRVNFSKTMVIALLLASNIFNNEVDGLKIEN